MILSASEMRALEEEAFGRGVSAETLMEQAGERCAAAMLEFFPPAAACVVVFGKGNNGGDALVAARYLARHGWEIHLVPAYARDAWSQLTSQKFEQVGRVREHPPGWDGFLAAVQAARRFSQPLVVLDGMLGIGARGELHEPLHSLVECINSVREQQAARVVAIDLPTGLDADTGRPGTPCLVADFTLTIGAAKQGLVADGAINHVGRIAEIILSDLSAGPALARSPERPAQEMLDQIGHGRALTPLLKVRPFDLHKGSCGRVSIVAGSAGFTGASRMCAEACVRAGAGLVTLHVPDEVYPIVATACSPEVMVKGVSSYRHVLEERHDVLALGPGLGRTRSAEVLALIRHSQVPTVLDADALNIISDQLKLLYTSEAPRLLTPHPVEMERLDPSSRNKTRAQAARDFVERYPVSLLLKGARTVVAQSGRPLSYNSTGSPGMATGGMGDILTGVCAALAGQKLDLFDAARVGSWVCGRAAELALSRGDESVESLTPTAVLAQLGRAFNALHNGGY